MNLRSSLSLPDPLFEFLLKPYDLRPQLESRLAGSAASIATSWRRHPLTLEAAVCRATIRWKNLDLLWTGAPPNRIADGLASAMSLRIIALGSADRRWSINRGWPYLPVSGLSAQLRHAHTLGKAVSESYLNRQLERFSDLFEHTRPQVLVMTANYDPAIRLLALAARQANVPTALYGHGISSPDFWLSLDDGLSTRFLCWTDQEASEYVRLGVPETSVHTVGPLRDLHRASDVPSARYDLLWLGSRDRSELYLQTLQNVIHLAHSQGASFAYRHHPLEETEDILPLVHSSSLLDPAVELSEHIRDSRTIVAGQSTSLLEAIMMGARTVFIDDLVPSASPAIFNHLANAADVSVGSADIGRGDLFDDRRRPERYVYRDPRQEIPRLISEGWFA